VANVGRKDFVPPIDSRGGEEEPMISEETTFPSSDEAGNAVIDDRRCAPFPSRILRHVRRAIPAISGYPARRKESQTRVTLADLNDEIAAEFSLEPKASALMEQVQRLIAEQPGGLEGFLEKFKASGLGAEAELWHGSTELRLTVRQVKKLVGTPFIKEVAKNLEIPQGFASKVLGAAIPKVARLLAAQHSSPVEAPPDVLVFPTFFALAHSRGRAGVQGDASKERNRPLRMDVGYGARLRFIVLAATLLITGGSLGYEISSAAAGHINSANPAAVTCSLASGIGSREITGDFAVGAGWIKNLTAEFGGYHSANPKALYAGKTLTMKRAIPQADDSARTIDSPQSALHTHAGGRPARPHRKT